MRLFSQTKKLLERFCGLCFFCQLVKVFSHDFFSYIKVDIATPLRTDHLSTAPPTTAGKEFLCARHTALPLCAWPTGLPSPGRSLHLSSHQKNNFATKPVDYFADKIFLWPEGYRHALTSKHIRIFFHMTRQTKTISKPFTLRAGLAGVSGPLMFAATSDDNRLHHYIYHSFQ